MVLSNCSDASRPPCMTSSTTDPPCQICTTSPPKYTCPRCSIRTCSLSCCVRHKSLHSCSGKRDRTGFVSLSRFNDGALRSDYHFLEDVLGSVEGGRRMWRCVGDGNEGRRKQWKGMPRNDGVPGGKRDDGAAKLPVSPLLRMNLDENNETKEAERTNVDCGEDGITPPSPKPAMVTDLTGLSANTGSAEMEGGDGPASKRRKTCSLLLSRAEKQVSGDDDWLDRYPASLKKLVTQARNRATNLLLVPIGMQKRKENTTCYNAKRGRISWRVELLFHHPERLGGNADGPVDTGATSGSGSSAASRTVLLLERVPEDTVLAALFTQNLRSAYQPAAIPARVKSVMQKIAEKDGDVHILLKKLPCAANRPRYVDVNVSSTVREALANMTIIEYPTLEVVIGDDVVKFPRMIEQKKNLTCVDAA